MRQFRITESKKGCKVEQRKGFWIFSWWSDKVFYYRQCVGISKEEGVLFVNAPIYFLTIEHAEFAIADKFKNVLKVVRYICSK